jgi:hypothetical protein
VRRVALLLVLLAGCAAPVPAPDPGPRYKGNPLSHWLAEVRDLSPSRKEDAATALRYFGEAAAPAIPDLIAALRYDDCEDEARHALDAIGPACLPAVLGAMTSSPMPRIRDRAALVVAVFVENGARGPEILDAIGRGLDDLEGAARWSAAAAGDLGADAAPLLPKLEALAKGDGDAARSARQSLEKLKAGK